MGVAAGHDATTAAEVVDLWSSTSKVAGATFVNLQPDRAKQPKLKTASGFIAGRCTFLSTVFNYASNAGTDKKSRHLGHDVRERRDRGLEDDHVRAAGGLARQGW
jgi:hypothetical protein